jgi:hypothetical protein
MVQEVGNTPQAAIVKLKLDCDTGIQRARVNPADGQVYAVGLNGWNGNGRKGLSQGGIHRFRYTGAETKLLTDASVTSEGVRLTFNFDLSQGDQEFQIEQWDYRWQASYGSKFYSVANPGKIGKDKVAIDEITIDRARRCVLLKISDIRPVNQMKVSLKVTAGDGAGLEEVVYLTINKVPGKELPGMKEITAAGGRGE